MHADHVLLHRGPLGTDSWLVEGQSSAPSKISLSDSEAPLFEIDKPQTWGSWWWFSVSPCSSSRKKKLSLKLATSKNASLTSHTHWSMGQGFFTANHSMFDQVFVASAFAGRYVYPEAHSSKAIDRRMQKACDEKTSLSYNISSLNDKWVACLHRTTLIYRFCKFWRSVFFVDLRTLMPNLRTCTQIMFGRKTLYLSTSQTNCSHGMLLEDHSMRLILNSCVTSTHRSTKLTKTQSTAQHVCAHARTCVRICEHIPFHSTSIWHTLGEHGQSSNPCLRSSNFSSSCRKYE